MEEIPVRMSLEGAGLLAPGALARWSQDQRERVKRQIQGGIKDARPRTDAILKEETRRAFKIPIASGGKFEKAWRLRVIDSKAHGLGLEIRNLAKWFKMHVEGGTIGKRSTPRAILIPINTRLGVRISTKKFYAMIDWLMREKLTVIRNGVLYVKPPMNTSRRGGVAVGSRTTKAFRTRFQGAKRRPSGFSLKLNDEGLTPIAVIRTSITMKRRFDLDGIARRRVAPVLAAAIQNRLASKDKRL